ncbi:ABC transporter substrate-binding protein [Enterococcus thailandicus]|uniref:ABC transporter substrate-binding protein n=1 Tax=Enterococcus thailandicus TaxID=417368 RepID=UPI0022EBE245|nr:ABC transporter substrate-binding protein [Enterococcus thailandicus]MDA3974596.1 ABC transporter substrate-binding protein [Enterococcus thailandicus]MDA3977082.1 ABC transporter substrate-binding protein [Enterococcus thailandicus]MDA3982136.1 ABC transporter substrate-binding protein [Enterococcus thailandicus]
MKKNVLIGLGLTVLLALGGCAQKSEAKNGDEEMKTVGVLQLVQHNSLDDSYKGFKEGLSEGGYVEGKNLTIDYQNAQNNQDNLKSMSEKLVKEKPDLLLGIATPAAQSLLNETTTIPITVTAVTDLKEAKLVSSNKEPGGNVTGTSDMVPIKKQIDLLLSIVPSAKKIGIMYNNGEANSKLQGDLAQKELEKAGIKVKVLTANSTNDVQQVTKSLAKDVDGIYIPTDNTFASAASVVGEVAKETRTPVVAGSAAQVKEGGLATVGIDYEKLGKQTGIMAAKILDGKATPDSLPVESADDLELVVNEKMADALGIDPSSIKVAE